MFSIIRKIREPYRTFLFGVSAILAITIEKYWPAFEYAAWSLFFIVPAAFFYAELREPVNYKSIRISHDVIEYVAAGCTRVIRLRDVSKLEFVREEAMFSDLCGRYIESKWVVQVSGEQYIELMDEWPHRKQLLQVFRKHLPCFDEKAAKKGIRAKGEGTWLCYKAKHCT